MIKQPGQIAESLNKFWIERYGICSMAGNCGKISRALSNKLSEKGYTGFLASGVFRCRPEIIGNHLWVVCDNKILDASVNQYGMYPVVVDFPSERYVEQLNRVFF